jgi:hypothetical protein
LNCSEDTAELPITVKAGPFVFDSANLELVPCVVWQAVNTIRKSKAIADFMIVSRLGSIETSNCKCLINL